MVGDLCCRMLALRMMPTNEAPHAVAESAASRLELCLQRTVVSAVLRHTDSESRTSCADVTVQLVQPGKAERTLKKLSDEGYVEGPAPSQEMLVTDGQQFTIRFRGNVRSDDTLKVRLSYSCFIIYHLLRSI